MMATFCERWEDRTTTGAEIVDLHEYQHGFYGVVQGRFSTLTLAWFKSGAAGNHTLGDLVPITKPPVMRPFRDLAEFAAAVWRDMPASLQTPLTPGMCLSFVRYRAKAQETWLAFLPAGWDWPSLLENCEWTIDPMDPVGRPFGVEE